MPVETRGSIDSHLRRGSFKNILETLKKEAEKQPDGMHPQVELSLEELIAMLQRQEVVRQVPGVCSLGGCLGNLKLMTAHLDAAAFFVAAEGKAHSG